ncbi:hypothetical protein [Rhizorhabdus sp. FW153]|uniref:hypothetical protein n=1 Tax=Rhizorhabdus sp. FW153 TaxID=3400216 RepID=UPI003CFB579C
MDGGPANQACEGTFILEVAPPWPWPPIARRYVLPDIALSQDVELSIQATPQATLLMFIKHRRGPTFQLESCPLAFAGEGYFKIGMGYSALGATIFSGGKCIASNEAHTTVEPHVQIILKSSQGSSSSAKAQPFASPIPHSYELFSGARAKLARGNKHVQDFQEAEFSFWDRKPYIIVNQESTDGATYNRIVRIRELIPAYFSLIIGDAIHNFRAALDLLAIDLVRANGGNTKNVYFPFSKNKDDFDEICKRRNIHRSSVKTIDLIRSLEPYHGGNTLLRGLHDLDILDKHTLIIPVAGLAIQPSLDLDFVNEIYVKRAISDAVKLVEDGTLLDANLPVGLEIRHDSLIFQTAFDEGQPFSNHGVLKTLEEISNMVRGVIEMFAEHLLESGIPHP